MTKILMVCLGNICRSPLAEGILQSKLDTKYFHVDSAGTGDWHSGEAPDKRSIETAKKHGVNIADQKARVFKTSDFETFDIIYVMDQSNLKNVLKLAPNDTAAKKVKLIMDEKFPNKNMEVPDPYYGTMQDFENVFQQLDDVCNLIKNKLENA